MNNGNFRKFIFIASIIYLITSLVAFGVYLTHSIPFYAVILGGLVALLPVPLYLFLALLLDRTEREPWWLLAVAFVWGATLAIAGSLAFNTLFSSIIAAFIGHGHGFLTASISAPFFEEFFKAIIIFIFFFFKRKDFNGIADGIVYALVVGLGFAMTENIFYYARSVLSGGFTSLLQTAFARGVASAYAHSIFTAMTGIGLGLSLKATIPFLKNFFPTMGFLGAVLLHSLWNSSDLLGRWGFELMYFVVFIPALLFVIGLSVYLVRNKK